MPRGLGYTQQKLLLLIAGGVTLGLTRSPKQYFRLLNSLRKNWKDLNSRQLHDATYKLYESGYISEVENKDGTVIMELTAKGKKILLHYDPDFIVIKKPKEWDRKWRVLIFDIPEHKKPARDALRDALVRIGFYKYQKSVFVYPYDCMKEMKFLIEHFEIRPFVRFMLADSMDNELEVRKYFNLE